MKLTKAERNLLQTFATIAQKILDSTAKSPKRSGTRIRKRRSAADVAALKKEIGTARKRKMSVEQIADELGVTTAYVYQLLR